MSAGSRIKSVRQKLGLDQPTFGKRIGEMTNQKAVSGSAVSRWESNDTLPSAKRLKAIADLGDVTVEYLIYGYDFNEKLFFKNLNDTVTYYYFSGDSINYGFEEYTLLDVVNDYFNSRGWSTPIDKYQDDTPAAERYLIKHLSILRSRNYIQTLVDRGAIYNGARGDGVKIISAVDEDVAIAVLCEQLAEETSHFLGQQRKQSLKNTSKNTSNEDLKLYASIGLEQVISTTNAIARGCNTGEDYRNKPLLDNVTSDFFSKLNSLLKDCKDKIDKL